MSDEMNNGGMAPTSGVHDAPLLVFSDVSGNPINEISLAPGEQKKIKVILSKQDEAVVQNFQAQWNVYDSNHMLTGSVACVVDPDTKKWLTPLCLSTDDDSVGGMNGNSLISAKVDNGVWRCMGKNPNGQFWYPRDLFAPPVPVAEFTLVASDDWTGNCVTLELDSNFTKFTQTADTAVPAASNYTTPCSYSMILNVKNANAATATPPQEGSGTSTSGPSTSETPQPPIRRPLPPIERPKHGGVYTSSSGTSSSGTSTSGTSTSGTSSSGTSTFGRSYTPPKVITQHINEIEMTVVNSTTGKPIEPEFLDFVATFNTLKVQRDDSARIRYVPARENVEQKMIYDSQTRVYKLSMGDNEYLDGDFIKLSARGINFTILENFIHDAMVMVDLTQGSLTGKIHIAIKSERDFRDVFRSLTIVIDASESVVILPEAPVKTAPKIERNVTSGTSSSTGTRPRPSTGSRPRPSTGSRPGSSTSTRPRPSTSTRPGSSTSTRPEPSTPGDIQKFQRLVNEYVSSFGVPKVEDGFPAPPVLVQSPNEGGAWVRGLRTPNQPEGIWFMINDEINSQLIYPGNVVLVDNDKKFTTNMIEIPFLKEERRALKLDAKYSNEMSGSSTQLNGFSRADVNAFIDQCLTHYKNSNHDLASYTDWKYEQSTRSEGVTIGGTIKGISFTGSAGEHNKTVTVAYLRQIMYTVSLNNEYSDASDLFTPSLDLPKFQRNIEKNGRGCSPAVIDAVRYGRLITLWAVQEGNKPVSLSIDKFFNLTVNDCQENTEFHLRVYGGIAGDQNFNIDTDSAKNIEQALHSLREVSKAAMETALPMEYTLKSLNNLTTNIQWKVLPYFKTYIPQVLLVFSEGVTFDVGLYANALDYQPYDNSGRMFDYVKKESTRCTLGTSWALSPKALCVEFKFDIAGGEANDFNVMLPCIPFELLEPDEKGAWTFKVHVFGPVITDAKHVDIRPNAPGTVFSKSNNFWMNKFPDSPMNVFDKAHATEKEIFEYYINWFNIRIGKKSYHYLSWLTSVKSLHDLRSYY